MSSFDTPILFLIFNRPDTTARVFETLRARKPKYLYIAADGPRADREGEAELCRQTRAIATAVDWDCTVSTLFREQNLGCRNAVQGAIDWFFGEVEEGIILEDDTLPDPGFFDYCATLLERYRHDSRVFSINGCNFGYRDPKGAYGFTRFYHMWGWASWRRSHALVKPLWQAFEQRADNRLDADLKRKLRLQTVWDQQEWYAYWERMFGATATGRINTWDYQWVYAALKSHSFCIRPGCNHIINIGFRDDATHPSSVQLTLANLVHGDPGCRDWVAVQPLIRDRHYENRTMSRVWTHYHIFRRSRVFRSYQSLRNKIRAIF